MNDQGTEKKSKAGQLLVAFDDCTEGAKTIELHCDSDLLATVELYSGERYEIPRNALPKVVEALKVLAGAIDSLWVRVDEPKGDEGCTPSPAVMVGRTQVSDDGHFVSIQPERPIYTCIKCDTRTRIGPPVAGTWRCPHCGHNAATIAMAPG